MKLRAKRYFSICSSGPLRIKNLEYFFYLLLCFFLYLVLLFCNVHVYASKENINHSLLVYNRIPTSLSVCLRGFHMFQFLLMTPSFIFSSRIFQYVGGLITSWNLRFSPECFSDLGQMYSFTKTFVLYHITVQPEKRN